MNIIPKAGDIWTTCGICFRVVGVAISGDSGERPMVIYWSYKNANTYYRSLESFVQEFNYVGSPKNGESLPTRYAKGFRRLNLGGGPVSRGTHGSVADVRK